MKHLKERLKKGDTLLGCWLNMGSPISAEIVGNSGFDWVLIDLEHGAGTESDLLNILQSIEAGNSAPVVRVESNARQRIQRALDSGAEGIMCPRIELVSEAIDMRNALKYPPNGSRGVAKMVRCSQFGANFKNYLDVLSNNAVGIVQVETRGILGHLDDIAQLDGVDVLFIGPSDLSMALGIFGEFDNSKFINAVKKTAKIAEKYGKTAGILLPKTDDFSKYHGMGFRFIASGSDATFVSKGALAEIEKLRVHLKK